MCITGLYPSSIEIWDNLAVQVMQRLDVLSAVEGESLETITFRAFSGLDIPNTCCLFFELELRAQHPWI